jgi:hypothetical protein
MKKSQINILLHLHFMLLSPSLYQYGCEEELLDYFAQTFGMFHFCALAACMFTLRLKSVLNLVTKRARSVFWSPAMATKYRTTCIAIQSITLEI